MAYTLRFSDPTKQTTVTVPDMPPGINSVDTSLSLVGRGYPNYGQKFAENFLHLLENFASPIPPENPVEGQLWYDTSNPYSKTLRIMDGTASAVRWPSANGIYQQGTNPNNSYTVKNGDLWVDTSENKVKLWNGLNWQLVGPQGDSASSQITGSVSELITDTSENDHWIIKHYVNGEVVSIVAGLTTSSFRPKVTIPGFVQLKPGLNLTSQIFNIGGTSQVNATALTSEALTVIEEDRSVTYAASEFLRKDDNTTNNGISAQEINGFVVFRSANSSETQVGRDGIVLLPQTQTTEYVQLYKNGTSGILLNNTIAGKLEFKVRSNTGLTTKLSVDPVLGVNINTSTFIYGDATISGSINIANTVTISKALTVNSILTVSTLTAVNSFSLLNSLNVTNTKMVPATDNIYSLGSYASQFSNVYAKNIGSTGTTFNGTLIGTADGFTVASQISMSGQVQTTSTINFIGRGNSISLVTKLTSSAIVDQTELTDAAGSSLLIVDSTNSLGKVSRANFLQGVTFPGMITSYGSNIPPTGWLLCNGEVKDAGTYPQLAQVLQNTYGGDLGANTFNVPAYSGADDVGHPIYFIIKY
jgi:hypothetical protein